VLQATAAKPTVKVHLAAIRMLFDWLVVGVTGRFVQNSTVTAFRLAIAFSEGL
jgi:hypothetical protein